MPKAAHYPPANATVQDFSSAYRGSTITPNVVVLHTTEGGSWPSYSGGASAPHLTAKPDKRRKRLVWRQHFPVTMSARALRNEPGGVETNTLNALQVELIGSCDRRDGYGALYWPDAPAWALRELAAFLAWAHVEWGVRLEAPNLWLPYPASYGGTRARLTPNQWRTFYGVCGHQHVPENTHGDPGDLNISAVLEHARRLVSETAAPASTAPRKPNRVTRARRWIRRALGAAESPTRRRRLRDWLRAGPKR